MLAEAGAAVLLRRVQKILPGQVELVQTEIATEGFDLVRPAPGMPALRRVAEQLMRNRRIDLIHPHATGTLEHDPSELAVLLGALGDPDSESRDSGEPDPGRGGVPDVYACKGALGHSLGASGLVSLVLAYLCAVTGRRPPMPWLQDPLDSPLALSAKARGTEQRPRTHAVFAAGFGGHVAGAVIRRHS